MNGKELKDALMDGRKVFCNGIEYSNISAIIYRNRGGAIEVSAELLDKNKTCVVIAQADKVQEVKND